MGTWDSGPFDNDSAADWCDDLDGTSPGERLDFIRHTLAVVTEEEDYLDSSDAAAAIAAAAVLASHLPGADPITSPDGPYALPNGETLQVPEEMRMLAVRALDRVVAEDSEWREEWADSADHSAFAMVKALRATLLG